MNKLGRYYRRARHPKGFWGKRALKAMNSKRHADLPDWAFDGLDIGSKASMLDVGCGGGANLDRLLKKCPDGHVTGIDFSKAALDFSMDLNNNAIVDGLCTIVGGNAVQMPLAKEIFDLAIAFETIYFWASIESGFSEIHRVLKPGGTIMVANELDGLSPSDITLSRDVGGMRVYTPDEIAQALIDAGFTKVNCKHDEQRHFVCVTARKL